MPQASENSCHTGVRLSGLRCLALLFALLCALLPAPLTAKVYLTRDQANKTCFPEADRFEYQIVHFNTAQIKTIERASRVKVHVPGLRCALAWHGKQLAGVVIFDYTLGKSEIINYCVALSPEGEAKQIEVLQYRESHGYEIRRPSWRKQFNGKTTTSKLRLHDDIANISGATISCRNVTAGVKRVLHSWKLVLRPVLVDHGKLPVGGK